MRRFGDLDVDGERILILKYGCEGVNSSGFNIQILIALQ